MAYDASDTGVKLAGSYRFEDEGKVKRVRRLGEGQATCGVSRHRWHWHWHFTHFRCTLYMHMKLYAIMGIVRNKLLRSISSVGAYVTVRSKGGHSPRVEGSGGGGGGGVMTNRLDRENEANSINESLVGGEILTVFFQIFGQQLDRSCPSDGHEIRLFSAT